MQLLHFQNIKIKIIKTLHKVYNTSGKTGGKKPKVLTMSNEGRLTIPDGNACYKQKNLSSEELTERPV